MHMCVHIVYHFVGWWMVDANGKIGWAPASYLVPVDEGDLAEEAKENEKLMSSMRGGYGERGGDGYGETGRGWDMGSGGRGEGRGGRGE